MLQNSNNTTMSRYFRFIDDISASLPDNYMDSDSSDQEGPLISEDTTEIINAPIEIITVSASDDEHDESGDNLPALSAAEVFEELGDPVESGDEGSGEPKKRYNRVDQEGALDQEDEDDFFFFFNYFSCFWGLLAQCTTCFIFFCMGHFQLSHTY